MENSPPAVHPKIIQAVQMLSEAEREEILSALDKLTRLMDDGDAEEDPVMPLALRQAKNAVVHLRESP